MSQIKFLMGEESQLPKSGIQVGALYHCEDTNNTYIGVSATKLELWSSGVGYRDLNNGKIGGIVLGSKNDYTKPPKASGQ